MHKKCKQKEEKNYLKKIKIMTRKVSKQWVTE